MSINGIPIEVRTDGKSQVETFYFPTERRAPQLRQHTNAMLTAEKARFKLAKRLSLAAQSVDDAKDDAEAEDAIAKWDKLQDEYLAADKAGVDAKEAFIREGFKAAGYREVDIDRFSAYLDGDVVNRLRQSYLFGAGRVNFTVGTALPPVPPSCTISPARDDTGEASPSATA